jgi:small neutral amino acid transporter SnatA (MarC family)
MLPTPTFIPTSAAPAPIAIPELIGNDAASHAIQLWNMTGSAGTLIQIAILLIIIIGGLTYIIKQVKGV